MTSLGDGAMAAERDREIEYVTSLAMPSPHELRQYSEVYSDLPREMWQEVQASLGHRREMEKLTAKRASIGQALGFLIALAFLAVSGWLINGDHDAAGLILGTVDLVALVTVFVIGIRHSPPS